MPESTWLMRPVFASRVLAGYCYTQLTDVEQEVNGLLTYDRKVKADVEKIRKANEMYRRMRVALDR